MYSYSDLEFSEPASEAASDMGDPMSLGLAIGLTVLCLLFLALLVAVVNIFCCKDGDNALGDFRDYLIRQAFMLGQRRITPPNPARDVEAGPKPQIGNNPYYGGAMKSRSEPANPAGYLSNGASARNSRSETANPAGYSSNGASARNSRSETSNNAGY